MDAVLDTDLEKTNKTLGGFVKTVFDTSKASKNEVANASQYALLALPPAYALLRLLREYVPEPDEQKGTLELTVEVIIQAVAIVVGIIIIDRAILYIPTLSGSPYGDQPNKILPLLPFIIILLTVQTKLGIKIDMLMERMTGNTGGQPSHQEEETSHEPMTNYIPRGGYDTGNPASQNNQMPPPHPHPVERALEENKEDKPASIPETQNQDPSNFSFGGGSALSFTPF